MPMNHGGDFEKRKKEARRKSRVINLSMAGVLIFFVIILFMFGLSFKACIDKMQEFEDRPENCQDSKPSIFTGDCSNKGHKLVVEDGVALCRCQE